MAEQNIKKIKLLKLMELLREETDEQNPMVAKEVCIIGCGAVRPVHIEAVRKCKNAELYEFVN